MFRLKTICSVLFMVILGSSLFIGLARRGQSEPSWARKYNSDCTLCHTIYPRLNRTGYIFRRLGYRFPAEVEKKKQPATVAHASLEASHPAVAEQETRYVPAPWSDTAAAGKSVVAKYSCATCHQIDGQGGRIGPSLDGVGSRRSKEFLSSNGFNPRELGRGVSVEYTMKGLTTLKAFAVYQSPPEFDTESDSSSGEETPEARRSRTYGFTFEKIIGSKGLSGVQFQYVGGYTPVAVGQQLLPALHFQRYSFFANKAFQDKRNVERVNIIGGFMALRDNRLLDFDEPKRSRRYGFFIETNWIPVRRLGFVTRFDQLRASTLLTGNIIRSETAAVIYDFTKYTRMMFEFRHAERSLPTNLYRIGWQLNF